MENETTRKYFLSAVLNIPVEEIRSTRLRNPFLRRLSKKYKLGIFVVVLELNDDTLIDIEIQLHNNQPWDKRQIYYLAKLYTSDFLAGQNYTKLKRCIAISILDFNLKDTPIYHRIYRLRDEYGDEFSNMLEIHIAELNKQLIEGNPLNEWIQFLNVKNGDELDMIKTNNAGILSAIESLKEFNFFSEFRALQDAKFKQQCDLRTSLDYAHSRGKSEAILEILSEFGTVSNELKERILSIHDENILNEWIVLAAKVKSIDEFEERIQDWG